MLERGESAARRGPGEARPQRRGLLGPARPATTTWSSLTETDRRSACWPSRARPTRRLPHPYPFDVLGAQTQGMIGYFLLQALENALPGQGSGESDLPDAGRLRRPGLRAPDQIRWSGLPTGGASDSHASADGRSHRTGTAVASGGGLSRAAGAGRDADHPETVGRWERGRLCRWRWNTGESGWRRAASRGRGGRGQGSDRGHSWPVSIGAEALLLLTDVVHVESDFGPPSAVAIRRDEPGGTAGSPFPPGSMGPKVEAACRFVEATGQSCHDR